MSDIRRREFTTLIGGAVAWPRASRAQQGERMRRIGVLMPYAAGDPETKSRLTAFRQALERLGWSEDRNVRIDYRFAAGSSDRYLPLARKLMALQPDVIVAVTTPVATTLQRERRRSRIVFSLGPTNAGRRRPQ